MTRHNDEAHTLLRMRGAHTRHNETHLPRFRWSDEAHDEAHAGHEPTRHIGCTPLGVRRAVCRARRGSAGGVQVGSEWRRFPRRSLREQSPGTARKIPPDGARLSRAGCWKSLGSSSGKTAGSR